MMIKSEIAYVRHGFSVQHMYRQDEPANHPKMEISHYDGAAFLLFAITREHCGDDKAAWLVGAVFTTPKRMIFMTGKDAHVHVMIALDVLYNIAPEATQ